MEKLKKTSLTKKLGLGLAAITVLGIVGSGSQSPQMRLNTQQDAATTTLTPVGRTAAAKKAPVITTRTITETAATPFDSKSVSSDELQQGTTKLTTEGVNGIKTLTYKVTYVDGQQTNKELISEVVTTQPVTQITTIGTYVAPVPNCPNGTYVNTAGNTVCSPYASVSAPVGATAQCTDGSYSFSQSRSGTCSHHGGVATWL